MAKFHFRKTPIDFCGNAVFIQEWSMAALAEFSELASKGTAGYVKLVANSLFNADGTPAFTEEELLQAPARDLTKVIKAIDEFNKIDPVDVTEKN